MSKEVFKFEGLAELQKNLDQFTRATQRRVVQRALIKAAAPIADAAKTLAPVDSGDLRDSIIIRARSVKDSGKDAYHQTLRAGGSKSDAVSALRDARRANPTDVGAVQVIIGPTADIRYAGLVEFGTIHAHAQPFMRPAFSANSQRALSLVAGEMKLEIERTAKRVAVRAAKSKA